MRTARGLKVGVDVGGTKIAAGIIDETGAIVRSARRPTPDSPEIPAAIAELVREVAQDETVAAVGIGAAGFISADRQTVLTAPNIDWNDTPLGHDVAALLGVPVVVENDANAAAWAEFRFGAAKGAESAVVVALGTGVGGGIIMNGELVRGAHGLAAEVGHLRVVPDGRRCGCGLRGCWEAYGSGSSLVREARKMASAAPSTAMRILGLAGGRADRITGLHVTEAALSGDPTSREAFTTVGTWLGKELAELAAVLDPEVFVIAGGVSEAGDLVVAPASRSYLDHLTAGYFREPSPIRLATLGNEAGWIGASDLARR